MCVYTIYQRATSFLSRHSPGDALSLRTFFCVLSHLLLSQLLLVVLVAVLPLLPLLLLLVGCCHHHHFLLLFFISFFGSQDFGALIKIKKKKKKKTFFGAGTSQNSLADGRELAWRIQLIASLSLVVVCL